MLNFTYDHLMVKAVDSIHHDDAHLETFWYIVLGIIVHVHVFDLHTPTSKS